jgi:hypothetical protein
MRAPSRRARLAPRLVFAGITTAAIASGVAAGCGIDYEGMLVRDVGLDASENVGANLPEGGTDGMSDGPSTDAGLDADLDADAAVLSCAASLCAAQGGGCEPGSNACTYRCDAGDSCAAGITCPPGVPCHVFCAGDDSCAGEVDCTKASGCQINCTGAHSCGAVDCAGATCATRCLGMDSCSDGGIHCEASDSCSIHCTGPGMMICKNGVSAEAPDASIVCDDKACKGGATCNGGYCQLTCNPIAGGGMAGEPGACMTKLCCDAGTCVIDGGSNTCPQP